MLERLARPSALLETPKYAKVKRFIDSSVSANHPLLEKMMGQKGRFGDITLTVLAMLKVELEFTTRLPKELLPFSRKAAKAWDSTPKEEREEAELDPEFCSQLSVVSTFFSNARRGNSSLGILLDSISAKRSMVKRWKLLQGLPHGSVPFKKVQDYFLKEAQECLQLHRFEATETGVMLFGERAQLDEKTGKLETIPGEIRLMHNNAYSRVAEYEEELSALHRIIANRLVVGYSPVLQ